MGDPDSAPVRQRRSSASWRLSGLLLLVGLRGSSGGLRGLSPAGRGGPGQAGSQPAEFVCDWETSYVDEAEFQKVNRRFTWPKWLPVQGLGKQCLMNHSRGLLDWKKYGGHTFNPVVKFTRNEALESIYWLLNTSDSQPETFHTTFWMRNGLAKDEGACKLYDTHLWNPRAVKLSKENLRKVHNITVIIDFREDREQSCIGSKLFDPRGIRSVRQINMEVIRKFAFIQLFPQMLEAGIIWPPWPEHPCTSSSRCAVLVTMNGPGERTNDLYGYYSRFHPEHWMQDGRPIIYLEHLSFDKRCRSQHRVIQLSMQMAQNSWHYEKFAIVEHYEPLLRSFLHNHADIIDFDRVWMYGMSTGGIGGYMLATIYASDVFSELILSVPMGIWKTPKQMPKQVVIDPAKRRLRRVTIAVGSNDIMYFTTLVRAPYALTMEDTMVWVTESEMLMRVPVTIYVYPKVWHNAHPMIQNELMDWIWRGGDPMAKDFLRDHPCGGTSVGKRLVADPCPRAIPLMLHCLLAGLVLQLGLVLVGRFARPSAWAAGRRGEAAQQLLHWWHPRLCAWVTRPAAGARWQGYGESGAPLRPDAAGAERLAAWVPWRALRGRAGSPPHRALRTWFPGGLTNAGFNEVDRHVLAGHGSEAAYVSLPAAGGAGAGLATSRSELLLRSAAAALALRRELRPGAGARVLVCMPSDVRQVVWLQACKRSGWPYACCAPGLGPGVLASRLADSGACAVLALDAPPWRSDACEALEAYALVEEVCRVLARSGLADHRGVRALSPDGRVVPLRAVLERPEVAALHRNARRLLAASRLGTGVKLLLLPPEPEGVGAPGPGEAASWVGGLEAAFRAAHRDLAGAAPPGAGAAELVARVWRLAGPPVALEASAPQFIVYPSDSAPRQLGLAWGHGGFTSGAAEALEAVLGAVPGEDALLTACDLSWLGGQAYQITGPLCRRVTVALVAGPPAARTRPQRLAEVVRPASAGPRGLCGCLRRAAALRARGWAPGPVAGLGGKDVATSGRHIFLATKQADCVLLGVPDERHGELPLACVRWSTPAAPGRRRGGADRLWDLMRNGAPELAVAAVEVESLPGSLGGGLPDSMKSAFVGGAPAGGALRPASAGGAPDLAGVLWGRLKSAQLLGAPGGLAPAGVGTGSSQVVVMRARDLFGFKRYALDLEQPELVGDAEWWEAGIHSLYGIAVCMLILRHWLPDGVYMDVAEPVVAALPFLRTTRFQVNVFFALGGLETRLEDGAAAGRKEAVLVAVYLLMAWSYVLKASYCDTCGTTLHRWMLLWLVLARGALSLLLRTPFSATQRIMLLYASAFLLSTLGGSPMLALPWGPPGAAPSADRSTAASALALLVYWAALYAAGYHWGPRALRLLRRPASYLHGRCACGALFVASLRLSAGSLVYRANPEVPEAVRDLLDATALPRDYPIGAALEALQLAAALAACGRGVPIFRQIGAHALGAYVTHPYWTMDVACAASGSIIRALASELDDWGGYLQLLLLVAFPIAFSLTVGTAAWYLLRIPMIAVSQAFVGGLCELAYSVVYGCTVGTAALRFARKAPVQWARRVAR